MAQRWPEIATERRAVIETRTAEGETCTLIALRQMNGQLGLYFHGGMRSSAMLPPATFTRLVEALTRLST